MATQAQIDAVTSGIVSGLQLAGTVAGTIDPALLPFIVIGSAAAKAIPSLVDDVAAMINGTEPTPEQNAALAAKISSLGDPSSL